MCKVNMDWYCPDCRGNIGQMKEQNEILSMENAKLREENKKLYERLGVLENKVEDIKNEVKADVMKDMNDTINMFFDKIKENEEKKKRENNLILFSVPESNKDNGKERQVEDEKICDNIFKGELHYENYEIKNVMRLGKAVQNQSRPRPILVKLANVYEKGEIIKRAKNLKNATNNVYKKVMISLDLNKEEREAEKKLRNELKEKRDRGEVGWFIKNRKLVKKNFA